MVSKKFDGAWSLMKFIEIEDYDGFGKQNGCKSPYQIYHGLFDLEDISQESTKFLTIFYI